MVLYNYREILIFKDGTEITRARVVGLIAEFFWRLAFHDRLGLNVCHWRDCTEIPLYNVLIRGIRRKELSALVLEEDAQLGLHLARVIVDRLLDTHTHTREAKDKSQMRALR